MRIKVSPGSSLEEIMFIPEFGPVYWKPWWRGHLHILRLIFQGHELEYDE
jgi:hypothetical protein